MDVRAPVCVTDLPGQGLRHVRVHRIALMCAEREPLECHRTLLVAPALVARGVSVGHILAGGGLETHGGAMDRLLAQHGMPDDTERQSQFLRPRDDRIREAIMERTKRFGPRKRTPSATAGPAGHHAGEGQT